MPLAVEHNVECYGYIIDCPDGLRIVFYTDTCSFNYSIPNVNVILGEVNYCDEQILDNLCNGLDVRSQFANHMGLDTAVSVIKRLQSPKLSKVVCLHLSDGNSDENAIKERIFVETGVRPLIAESSMNICLDDDF